MKVPVMEPGHACSASSLPAHPALATAPHGLCSIDIRFYCETAAITAAHGDSVSIRLRCFAVDSDRNQELCQVLVASHVQPLIATKQSRSFAEWKDVGVPCRSVLEVSFSFGAHTDTYLVYVGQVPKLFIMTKAASELMRCLSSVNPDDWFRACGPNLSPAPPRDICVVLPQQFSADRYTKVLFFDLKEEYWNVDDRAPVFRRRPSSSRLSEFYGRLRPGNYRLYLWDSEHQKWIMDGCTVQIAEAVAPDSALLFGHRQDSDREDTFGASRLMSAQVSPRVQLQFCCFAVLSTIFLTSHFSWLKNLPWKPLSPAPPSPRRTPFGRLR